MLIKNLRIGILEDQMFNSLNMAIVSESQDIGANIDDPNIFDLDEVYYDGIVSGVFLRTRLSIGACTLLDGRTRIILTDRNCQGAVELAKETFRSLGFKVAA